MNQMTNDMHHTSILKGGGELEKKTLTINNRAKSESIYSYELIQYTHHIHFQYYETGACLKVSEVKPKLDKFIQAYCKRHDYILTDECYAAQPDEEKTALNYKIQIYPKDPGKRRDFVPDAQKGNDNEGWSHYDFQHQRRHQGSV